jgi:hypothetical protein
MLLKKACDEDALDRLKDKVSMFEGQIAQAERETQNIEKTTLPKTAEIKVFAEKAALKLQNLSFESKKAIVRSVIKKVVGTRTHLEVFGYIPVNINVFTINRNRRAPKRW